MCHGTDIAAITLPEVVDNLEVLKLHFRISSGHTIMKKGQRFTRLRHLVLPESKEQVFLDSACFPVLSQFKKTGLNSDEVLNLSGLSQSDVELDLTRFFGEITSPSAPLGWLTISAASLGSRSLCAILPSVQKLKCSSYNDRYLSILYNAMHRTSLQEDKPFASPTLQELRMVAPNYENKTLGAFPKLRRMVSTGSNITMHGDNFRCLETLALESGRVILIGNFPTLRSLSLLNVHLELHPSFCAHCLSEISFADVHNACEISVNKRIFPALQKVTVEPYGKYNWQVPTAENGVPLLRSDPTPSGSPLVTLSIHVQLSPKMAARLPPMVPHWAIIWKNTKI